MPRLLIKQPCLFWPEILSMLHLFSVCEIQLRIINASFSFSRASGITLFSKFREKLYRALPKVEILLTRAYTHTECLTNRQQT